MAHAALETMLRNQVAALAICQSQTSVEYESDPSFAGRTAIRVNAPSRAEVQFQIDKLMALVDRDGGFANFIGPSRTMNGYLAVGEVIMAAEEKAA